MNFLQRESRTPAPRGAAIIVHKIFNRTGQGMTEGAKFDEHRPISSRNGLKIRWAVIGPCRFESGHRHGLKSRFSQGRFVKIYLATIRQVIPFQNRFKNFGLGLLIRRFQNRKPE